MFTLKLYIEKMKISSFGDSCTKLIQNSKNVNIFGIKYE